MSNKKSLPMESFKEELLKKIKKHDTIIIHSENIDTSDNCSAQAALKKLVESFISRKESSYCW